MISLSDYKSSLSVNGKSLAEARRKQSDRTLELTFSESPEYKKVYILTTKGWVWEDAQFFRHGKQSITDDDQDYYLRFKPKVRYPIGTYVLIPKDEEFELDITESELKNPFTQSEDRRTEWWIIVNKNNNIYTEYNILKVNWTFKWIQNGEVWSVPGIARDSRSYTSGSWAGQSTVTLDNVDSFWVPDTYHIYYDMVIRNANVADDYSRENAMEGLYDTREIAINNRFIISRNELYPQAFRVSKVQDTTPQGLIKVTLEQDEYNPTTDNSELKIANYYTSSGNNIISVSENDSTLNSQILEMIIDTSGESTEGNNISSSLIEVNIGSIYYYKAYFGDDLLTPEWGIELSSALNSSDKYSKSYYEKLIEIIPFDDMTVGIKIKKAKSLIGKQFTLTLNDIDHQYSSSFITLEVVE